MKRISNVYKIDTACFLVRIVFSNIHSEAVDDFLYSKTKPNKNEIHEMITGENVFKCQSTGYQWTAWSSFTNLSDTDGNDFETLDLHRDQNPR